MSTGARWQLSACSEKTDTWHTEIPVFTVKEGVSFRYILTFTDFSVSTSAHPSHTQNTTALSPMTVKQWNAPNKPGIGLQQQSRRKTPSFCVCVFVIEFFSPLNGATAPRGPRPPYYRGFTITLRHTTFGMTPPDKWSAQRRDLYLTTHETHDRHPCLRWDSNPQSQQASGRRPTP
jgi:hypothetical protein